MAWFRKEKTPKAPTEKQVTIPEGLWIKCDECKEIVYRKEVEANFNTCPKCTYHFRLTARERFELLFDDGKGIHYHAFIEGKHHWVCEACKTNLRIEAEHSDD